MSKRIKAISEIRSRAEFDEILEFIVTMQLHKEKLELQLAARVLAAGKELTPDITHYRRAIEANVLRAEKYATAHRDELLPGKKKTGETGVTFFGFRTGNPTLVLLNRKWTWAKVLEALKARGWVRFVVVKESVDKDAMKQQSPEALASVGTRVEQTEAFFIEPKRDAADPHRLAIPAKEAA